MKEILEIPLVFDQETYDSWIKLERYSDMKGEIDQLLNECLPLVKPRVIIKEAYIDRVDKDKSVIEGHEFNSKILAWNLARTDRVWAHVISCGQEIYERLLNEKDPLRQYWIDALAELAVQYASEYLADYMKKNRLKEGQGILTYMNPGSADRDVWDLKDQRTLFELIGNVDQEIGVSLTQGSLMEPSKSLSGLYFQSKEGFISCWVCSQPSCKTRQSVYKKDFKNMIERAV
jgi:hypothetical protein